eukprot:scaffold3641_cov120-Cylindrotheca_fusiformis.AAC.2
MEIRTGKKELSIVCHVGVGNCHVGFEDLAEAGVNFLLLLAQGCRDLDKNLFTDGTSVFDPKSTDALPLLEQFPIRDRNLIGWRQLLRRRVSYIWASQSQMVYTDRMSPTRL